jgi:ABC-2 type transport system permease protein
VSGTVNEFPVTPALVLRQVRYQQLSFRRTPIAVFFTLALPLIMLLLFNALFGDEEVDTEGGTWPLSQFYTGSLAAFTAVSATFTNLANLIPVRREEGVLKRWRGTPLSPWIYIAGAIGSAVVIAAVGVVIMITVGVVAYDLDLDAAKMPAAVVTFIVGVASFAALGLAVASLVPNPDAAPAVTNAIILPLAFVSDVFIQIDDPPAWVDFVGDVFPLKAFVQAFQAALNPNVEPPGFEWGKLAFVAAWGVAGLLVALRWFKWEPSTRRRTRRRSEPVTAG